jgi:hypothetical protein
MNKIVLIGSLLVGFQANVEQKILPFFRFVQRLLLSAMFIVGLSITPINAAVIQVSFTGPTFDRVEDNGYFDVGGTFDTSDFVSGFFSFNDDDLIADELDSRSSRCSNCFDVDNFRASAGLISISGGVDSATVSGDVQLYDGVLASIAVSFFSGEYSAIGDVQKFITFSWNFDGRQSYASVSECIHINTFFGCQYNADRRSPAFNGDIRAHSYADNNDDRDNGISLYNAVLSNNPDIAVVVPEPSIIALFTLGLVGIGFARRRRS